MHGDIKNNNIVYTIMDGFRFIDFNLSEDYGKN
jgi:tRNA A-37 threonylcarbamoyl transferase component Bud32